MRAKLQELWGLGPQIRVWWSSPADYNAQVAYFAQRGLLGIIQLLIGVCCAVVAAVPIIVQFSPEGPSTQIGRTIESALAVSAIAWALVWWFAPWPTYRCSIAFIIYADIGITVVALSVSNPLAGLVCVNALALTSFYAKFFCGPRVVALQTVWVLVAVGVVGTLIGTSRHGDVYLATAVILAASATLVTTPLVVHFGLWVLRTEANDSMTDQLTGLLNRRGLNLQIGTLVQSHPLVDIADAAVAVMVIDLDRFKHVNDTYGHAVGDRVLIRSARRITCSVRSSALITRVGGEEFVVVDVVERQHIPRISERVRLAIEATADAAPVTASVGVAAVSVDCFMRTGADPVAILGTAIECADHAMFEAKRNGGNATSHTALLDSSGSGIACDCVGQTADSDVDAVRDDA